MNDANQTQKAKQSIAEFLNVQPVETEVAARADKILNSRTKQNVEMGVVSAKWATNDELLTSTNFDSQKKLILAEVLTLVADSLDPSKQEFLKQDKLVKTRRQLKSAIGIGVGQMLKRLRPMEVLANQLQLWKANSTDPQAKNLPKEQTSLLIGPNMLINKSFQRIIEHEMKQTNLKTSRGLYRSFMFIPFDKLDGGSMSLVPYLRMAGDLNFHIMGSLQIRNSLDEMGRVKESWKFTLNDVSDQEQDILANATCVVNQLVVRPPHTEFHEEKALECGAEYSFASQMTKYFQRKKDGHWEIPVLHPTKKASELCTVNTVDVLDSWRDAVENQFNFAYTVAPKEGIEDAGVRVYGSTTMFPSAEIDIEELGSQAVPKMQSQARVMRNRIYFYLITQLERFVGGNISGPEVRREVGEYLEGMKSKHQISNWKILEAEPDKTGKYKIRLSIEWSPLAREFEIDAEAQQESDEGEN